MQISGCCRKNESSADVPPFCVPPITKSTRMSPYSVMSSGVETSLNISDQTTARQQEEIPSVRLAPLDQGRLSVWRYVAVKWMQRHVAARNDNDRRLAQ